MIVENIIITIIAIMMLNMNCHITSSNKNTNDIIICINYCRTHVHQIDDPGAHKLNEMIA